MSSSSSPAPTTERKGRRERSLSPESKARAERKEKKKRREERERRIRQEVMDQMAKQHAKDTAALTAAFAESLKGDAPTSRAPKGKGRMEGPSRLPMSSEDSESDVRRSVSPVVKKEKTERKEEKKRKLIVPPEVCAECRALACYPPSPSLRPPSLARPRCAHCVAPALLAPAFAALIAPAFAAPIAPALVALIAPALVALIVPALAAHCRPRHLLRPPSLRLLRPHSLAPVALVIGSPLALLALLRPRAFVAPSPCRAPFAVPAPLPCCVLHRLTARASTFLRAYFVLVDTLTYIVDAPSRPGAQLCYLLVVCYFDSIVLPLLPCLACTYIF
ncbi:hypothetical protein C8R47DRAFT_1210393 [Mycena vitilis]|nr:hypothetical protein C8R47DRAFT_1210393 [Mycena vitilis]